MKNKLTSLEYISQNRYRETSGMYYEDFIPGDIIEHNPGRTISETDNTWITLLSMNQHPLHFDAVYANETEFGSVLVNSVVTFAIVNGMTVRSLSAKATANLGWDNVKLMNPLFVGDTLYAESEILTIRPSKSRPSQGIIKVKTTGYKQNKMVVLTYERYFLVPRKKCNKYHDKIS